MVMFTYKPGNRVKVENGEYLGELLTINENIEGKYGPCVRFVFRIIGGEYEGVAASILAKDDWSPGSKLDLIIRALGVEPLDFGSQFDSESLIGKQARIYVESDEKNGQIHNNVTKYRAVKLGNVSTPPAAVTSAVAPQQAPAAVPAKPALHTTSIGTTEVKEPGKTPTGVTVVDEITF